MDESTVVWILIGIAVGIFALSTLLSFILKNWLLSKILSELCSVVSLINSFFLVDALSDGRDTNGAWIYIVCTVFGWVFFMAATIFETEFEGWEITVYSDSSYDKKPLFSGGFWGNFGAAVGATILTLFIGLGGEFYAIFIIVPILILLVNTISIFAGASS